MENDDYFKGRYPSSPPFLEVRVRKSILAILLVSSLVAVLITVVMFMLTSANLGVRFDSPDGVLFVFVCTFLTLLFSSGHYGRLARKIRLTESLAFQLSIATVVVSFVGFQLFVRH
jgi:hypothetical protein